MKSRHGKTAPHPQSLSRRERDEKPFSHREKGGDEGIFSFCYKP
jgi:hypothetical protein